MWCFYNDTLCLNPLCLGGCVSEKSDREYKLKKMEKEIEVLKLLGEGQKPMTHDISICFLDLKV